MLYLRVVDFVQQLLLYTFIVSCEIRSNYDKSRDSLILKPIELIDMILEERLRKEVPVSEHNPKVAVKLTDSQLGIEKVSEAEALNSDYSQWPRKVWSKWSKWGECSTTCGWGAKERRRVCVGGRCAHGELELQRRPCRRQPCTYDNLKPLTTYREDES